jgi:hypothetical protein
MSITYVNVDYSARVAALRAVGTALGAPGKIMPAPWASPGEFLCLQYINNLRVFMGEAPLTNLDYTGFQAALNELGALVAVPPPVPVVTPGQSFNYALPGTPLMFVGTVVASNTPTAFAIVSGNGGGFFTIGVAGILNLSATGAGLTAGTYTLGVTATNAGGTSPAVNVTVIAA